MIITALHFKRNNSSIFHSYKFAPGKGNLRNTWMVSGKDIHPQWVLESLKSLFIEENSSSFDKIILEASDDAGDSIVIEKDRGIREFYKNGSLIGRKDFLEALFGEEIEYETFLPENDIASFKVFNLPVINKIVARNELDSLNYQKTIRSLSRDIVETKKSLISLLRIPTSYQSDLDWNSLRKVSFHKDQYRLISNEIAEIEKLIESSEDLRSSFHTLDDQSRLIIKIESSLSLVENMVDNIVEVEKKRSALVEKMNILKADIGITPKTAIKNKKLYKKGFRILARMELLNKVVSILEQKRHHLAEHIKSPFSDTTRSIEKLLSTDNFAFSELSEKLTFMETTLLAGNISLDSANTKSQTWFEKFKKSEESDVKSQEKILDVGIVSELKSVSFEVASKIQDLRANFTGSSEAFDQIDDSFEALFEAYVERINEIKSQWIEFSKLLNADKHSTFTGYCDFYIKSMQLISYSIQKTGIDNVLESEKNSFETLKNTIIEWRKLTKSHKKDSFDSASQILNEARAVLKYKDTVTAKHRASIVSTASYEAISKRLGSLKESERKIKSYWAKAFIHAENRPTNPQDNLLDEITTSFNLLSHFKTQKTHLQSEGTITPFSDSGALFSTWMIDPEIESDEDCQNITAILTSTPNNSCESKIIATEHTENALYFHKKGCGRVVELPGIPSIEALYQQLGIKKQLISTQEIDAMTAPIPDVRPSQTLAFGTSQKEAPTLDLNPRDNRILKANRIQKTLDILNGNSK